MVKPLSRILVIEDEPLVLREIVKGLNAAARSLDNPLGITFSGVTTAREALAAIEADGDIQAVLVDDKLYSLPSSKNANGRKKLQMSALELVQRITRFRPELDVYILIAQEKEDDVVDALFTEAVDGFERSGVEPKTILLQKWAIASELLALKRPKEASRMFDQVVAGAVEHLDPGDPFRKRAVSQQRGYRILGRFSGFGRRSRQQGPGNF